LGIDGAFIAKANAVTGVNFPKKAGNWILNTESHLVLVNINFS